MKKILIIKHGALGDVILSLRAIVSIKEHFINSNITILTEKKYINIFSKFKFIDKIKIDNRIKPSPLSAIGLIFWFAKNKFDWVFDLQTSKRTTLYYNLFTIFGNFKWNGRAKGCSHIHNDPKRTQMHTLDRHKQQLYVAGIKKIKSVNWNIFRESLENISISKKFAIIIAGGAINRPNKRWSLDKFIKLAYYFKSKSIQSVFIGGKDEKAITHEKLPKKKLYIKPSW